MLLAMLTPAPEKSVTNKNKPNSSSNWLWKKLSYLLLQRALWA
jgi:hypothetical protein